MPFQKEQWEGNVGIDGHEKEKEKEKEQNNWSGSGSVQPDQTL